jgi:ribosome maturation protein Sdo1
MIMNGMREIHYPVKPTRTAKQQVIQYRRLDVTLNVVTQAREVIRLLAEHMPIQRALMHLRVMFAATGTLYSVILWHESCHPI